MSGEAAPRSLAGLLFLAKGAGLVLFGTAVGNGLRYVFQILIARRLGSERFGLFILGLTVFTTAEILALLGLSQGVVRFVSLFLGQESPGRIKGIVLQASRAVIGTGIAVGAGLLLLSKPLAFGVFGQPSLAPVIRAFAVIIPFSALGTILLFSFQGLRVLENKIVIGELAEPALRIVSLPIVFALGGGLQGIVLSYGLVTLLILALAGFALGRTFPAFYQKQCRPVYEGRRLFHFSWPLLFSQFLGQLLLAAATFLLGAMGAPEDVGVFGAALRTSLIASLVLASLQAVFAPLAADLDSRKEHGDLADLFKLASKWAFSPTLPICLLFMLLAEPICRLFGAPFVRGAGALAVLSAGWLVHSALGLSGTLLVMSGRSRLFLADMGLLVVLNVALCAFLIPSAGVLGAAQATALSIVLVDLIMLVQVYRLLRIHPYRKDFLKPIAAGAASLAATWFITERFFRGIQGVLPLIILCAFCIMIYVIVLAALKFSPEEKLVLKRAWDKARGSRLPS
jgi:O-antigen/teichoic acid export membrane protein